GTSGSARGFGRHRGTRASLRFAAGRRAGVPQSAWRVARARDHTAPDRARRSSARGGVALRQTRDPILGIRNALVVHPEEQLAEGVLDLLHVGEHDDRRLLRPRARAGIAVLRLIGILAALLRELEEVLHDAVPMMPGDHL